MFGKSTEVAIAVMSRLAESYSESKRLSAASIARDCGLKGPFVGKVLSTLAAADLVTSVRGPGGGFALSRPPEHICIMEVVLLFERSMKNRKCLAGGGLCSKSEPCPLHQKIGTAQSVVDDLLRKTTFAVVQPSSDLTAEDEFRSD